VAAGIAARAAVAGALNKATGSSWKSAAQSGAVEGLFGSAEVAAAAKTGGRLSLEYGVRAFRANATGKTVTRVRSIGGGYAVRGSKGKFAGTIRCLFC
jgi:hypothetical protein